MEVSIMKTSSTKKKREKAFHELTFDEQLRASAIDHMGGDPLCGALAAATNDLRVCIAAIEADAPGDVTGAGGETVSLLLRTVLKLEACSGEAFRRAKSGAQPEGGPA
jgi:hypothetical protein